MTPTFTGTLYWLFNFQFQLCQWKFAPCLMLITNDEWYLIMINDDYNDKTGPQWTVRWSSSQAGWRIRFRTSLEDTNMITGSLQNCLAPRRDSARTGRGRGGGLRWSPPGPGSYTPCHHSGQTVTSVHYCFITNKHCEVLVSRSGQKIQEPSDFYSSTFE